MLREHNSFWWLIKLLGKQKWLGITKTFLESKKNPTKPNFKIHLQNSSNMLIEERKFIIINCDPCLHVILSIRIFEMHILNTSEKKIFSIKNTDKKLG